VSSTPHTNPKQTHPRNLSTSQLKPGARPSTAKPINHGENKPAHGRPNNQPARETGREKEKKRKVSHPAPRRGEVLESV
jgi:hypothetical protein